MEELTDIDHARIALAAEFRRGMHLTVGQTPDVDQLRALTDLLRTHLDAMADAPPRVRGEMPWRGTDAVAAPADGDQFPDSVFRPVSGSGNPFSVPMTMVRDGDTVVSTVTLGAGFEGAPGRSHGGFVSAIFDDLFGSLPMLHHKIAFTASLTVNYVAPSPVFEPVTYRGWVDRIEGKKIFIEGEAHHGDVQVSTASALFIDATEAMAKLYGA